MADLIFATSIAHNTIPQTDLLASYEVNTQLNAIEDLIAQGADMQIVLRLLCLASLTAGGVKSKSLDNIKREILQVCLV